MFHVLSGRIREPSEELGNLSRILEKEVGGKWVLDVLNFTRLYLSIWEILSN